jgi:hypothetical protein
MTDRVAAPLQELFELELLGGPMELRYRRARPEVEAMPWGTLELAGCPEETLIAARRSWTGAAFQEHRTAVACCATLRALVEARAPLDLIAGFARFPLDEIVHVELCARMATELGGGTELLHEPAALCADPDAALAPILRATQLVTHNFCVGETLSIPLLHGACLRARQPLARAVLRRIVRDEAAHGVFGWTFLDWALPLIGDEGRELIAQTAVAAIQQIQRLWEDLSRRPPIPQHPAHALGWFESVEYRTMAKKAMRTRVVAPFVERGIQLPRELQGSGSE